MPGSGYGQIGDFWDLPVTAELLQNAVLAKSARHALSQIYFQTIFDYFHHGRRSSYIRKNRIRFAIDCKSSGFLIEAEFFHSLFKF